MTRFPDDFLWGVSTSAYQVEGAVHADGRSPSIWDTFVRRPGAVERGDTGDVACDHYHRWPQDVALLGDLGVNSYRFSLAWSRLLPDGVGKPNPAALAHYDRLLDTLAEAGITPLVTLYHWDLPQALQDRGGWAERDSAAWFAEYAEVCFQAFGDRVGTWVSINEPWIIGVLGHQLGLHAPGETDVPASLRVMHHLLLGHGLAARALRASGTGGRIGCAFSLFPNYPDDPADPADVVASDGSDGYVNRWFLDPVFGRGYPADTAEAYRQLAGEPEHVRPGDLEVIASGSGFIGVNYYTRRLVRADPARTDRFPWSVRPPRPGVPLTDAGWEIVPECLTDLLVRLRDDYGDVPIIVTENGAVFDDAPDTDGRVRDERRTTFLREHVLAIRRALDAGVRLEGYFHWSLMDNFEWALGYGYRFGLVHVDYATQVRTIKDSGRYYRDLIAVNGVPD